MNWLVDHWEIIVLAAWLALSLMNTATKHYDAHGGVRRLLMLALDWVSALRSSGAEKAFGSCKGLQAKLPLVQLSPPADLAEVRRRVSAIRKGGAALLVLLLFVGCTAGGARKAIVAASEAAEAAVTATRAHCRKLAATECKTNPCPALNECHKAEGLIVEGAAVLTLGLKVANKVIK